MNGAIIDSTFNIFFKLKYDKVYDAVLATPMRTVDVARGEIAWALMRGGVYSAAFLRRDGWRWGWSTRGGRCSRCRRPC